GDGRPAVARKSLDTGARHGVHDTARNLADLVGTLIDEVQISGPVGGAADRYDGTGRRCGPAVARGYGCAVAEHGGNDAIGGHPADAIVAVVVDVDVILRIDARAQGSAELRLRGGSPVAREPYRAGACERRDHAGGSHLPNSVVEFFRQVDIALRIRRQPDDVVDLRLRG